jgi:hypothetical protein
MTNAESAALWDRLYRDVVQAEIEHCRVQEQMDRLLAEGPSGLPLSDSVYRRTKTQNEVRRAFEKYQRALGRFRAFVDEGIIPDGLDSLPGDGDSLPKQV